MSPLLALGLLLAGFCPAAFCHPGGPTDLPTPAAEDRDNGMHVDNFGLATSNIDFAFSLYKQLASKTPDKNIIFSPLSISTVLALLSLGARNTTLSEILQGLKFNLTQTSEAEIHRGFRHLLRTLRQPNSELHLHVGNAMFIEEQLQLLAKFAEDARDLYAAETFNVNFQDPPAAQQFINDFVKKETQGKIPTLIDSLDRNTMLILVNYVLFKGKWMLPFDPRDTHQARFYLNKTEWVEVPMMNLENQHIPYVRDEDLSCTVVELGYKGNASSLLILPDDEDKMHLVEAALSPASLKRWREALQPKRIDELYLPKFSISSKFHLESTLPELGIREVFSSGADLSGITGARNLCVSEVIHKAVLDVAENGTEAAAATGVNIVLTSVIMDPVVLRFNKPFLVIITDKNTQSVIFLGKVTNPKET